MNTSIFIISLFIVMCTSHSMYPTMMCDEVYGGVPAEPPFVWGEIYIYSSPINKTHTKQIVHRLLYTTIDGEAIFKGDNNMYSETVPIKWITHRVLGKRLK